MNRIQFILLFCLFSFSASAVKTVINGRIIKPGHSNSISLQYYASPLDFIESFKTEYQAPIDERGGFRIEFDIDRPISINLLNGNEWIFYNKYILPGDSLFFEFSLLGTKIQGIGKERMTFQFKFDDSFYSAAKVEEFQVAQIYPAVDYAAFLQRDLKEKLAFFNEFFREKELSPAFTKAYESEVKYQYMVNLVQYCWRAGNSARSAINDERFRVFLDAFPIQNEEAVVSTTYLHFIRELPYALWTSNMDRDNKESPVYKYYSLNQYILRDSIAQIYFKDDLYDIALYGLLLEQIQYLEKIKGTESYTSEYNSFAVTLETWRKKFTNLSYFKRIKNKFETITGPVKPAFDFIGLDSNGKQVKISDFKGKVVYIDFWATSCFPCLKEFEPLRKLEEKYQGKEVVFLSVSFDGFKDTWMKFLKQRSLSGIQLLNPKGFGSEVATLYNISSIPRCFLIDKNGLLVSERAPRPSEHLIEAVIDNALSKK